MNQVFVGGIALIIAFILWSSKNQSKGSTFFKSQKDSFLNTQASSSLVIEKCLETQTSKKQENKKSQSFSNNLSIDAIAIKKELNKLISSDPDNRLLAIQIASQWKNKQAIPYLKRGLKDSDSRVVIASASAMTTYRGKTIYSQKKSQAPRPPRNVSLIR